MARMRVIKPGMRTSKLVASWPIEQRYFFAMLWGYLDDYGRGLDIPRQIAADCFPHDEKITAARVDRWINGMLRNLRGELGPLCRYTVDGVSYLHAVNWGEHQKPNRPTDSQHPPCPTHTKVTEPIQGSLTESLNDDSVSVSTAAQPLRGRGVEGLKGGGVDAVTPPPPRCLKHQDQPADGPCGPCKDARLIRADYDAREFQAEQAQLSALRHCRLCNVDGNRLVPGRGLAIEPPEKCDHRAVRSVS